MAVTYKLDNLREKAPLYRQYAGQVDPQRAYVEIDENGDVTADYSGVVGSGMPVRVWNGRTRRYRVHSESSGPALDAFLRGECKALLERVHAGLSVKWDGNNYVGGLSDDAQDAEDKLERLLEEFGYDNDNLAAVWGAGDWLFQNNTLSEVWPAGETLDAATKRLQAEADSDGAIIVGGDIRDELIEKAHQRFLDAERVTDEQIAALKAEGRVTDDEIAEYQAEKA